MRRFLWFVIAAVAAAACLLAAATAHAAGPATFGVTPAKGTASTAITATFSFKTATAAACTSRRIDILWDGRLWTTAPAAYIAGNGTCTGDATTVPPTGATPGAHDITAHASPDADAATAPAPFLLLNADGSVPAQPTASSTGDGGAGFPLLPMLIVGVAGAAVIAGTMGAGRRRRPARG